MPNWCANALVIEATTQENAQELRRLTAHMEDEGTLFSFFMPLKEGEYGGDVWGTKWEADVESYYGDGDRVEVYFSSAWSPPTEFYKELFEKHNFDVTATFVEQGINYIGYYVNGDYHEQEFMPEDFDYEQDDYHEIMEETKNKYFDNLPYEVLTPSHTGG